MAAGKSQGTTTRFVYSEAVNRALRQRCRCLAAATSSTTPDEDVPALPPELLLAVLNQSGDVDLGILSGKSSRLPVDTDGTAAASDDSDYEIINLAEIYREISPATARVKAKAKD